MKIGIIGLGLIGGSFSLALKKECDEVYTIGYDHNPTHQKEAKKLKLVDEVTDDFSKIKEADVIILAIPVEAIIKTLQNLLDIKESTTIIDLGSTKEKIIKNTPQKIRKNLVAAHPMAGTENTGPKAAFDSLFENKIVVLCDIENSGKKQKEVAIKIFRKLKMKIVYMDPKEHDMHAAYISHLPHALSFALANAVLKQEDPKSIVALAGGGFNSMIRLAKSSDEMWSDIFKQNQKNVLDSIEFFQKELDELKNMIKEQKWDEVKKWMKNANLIHNIL